MHRDIPAKGILKAFYEMTDEADTKGYREKLDAFYGDAEWSFGTQVINSTYKNLGSYLQEEFEEAYFVIGTDFYNTTCSIAEEVGRKDYEFCSDDP